MTVEHPDYAHALRTMADNIGETLGHLTTRLEQRSAALDRVVAEKEAYRKALVRVLELEGTRWRGSADGEDGEAVLTRDEVHDAIGGDLIMALMYRPRVILPAPPEGDVDWAATMKDARLTALPDDATSVDWHEK